MSEKFSKTKRASDGSFYFVSNDGHIKISVACRENHGVKDYELFLLETTGEEYANSEKMWDWYMDPNGYFAGKIFDFVVEMVKASIPLDKVHTFAEEAVRDASKRLYTIDNLHEAEAEEVDKFIAHLHKQIRR